MTPQAGLGDPLNEREGGLSELPREQSAPLREGPRQEGADPLRASRVAIRLEVDPHRERLHEGPALIDPFDITDLVQVYAPTGGDLKKGNIDNEIDFNWKRYETYGKGDFAERRMYHQQGWRPVLHAHFPGRFAPEGTEGPVIVKDMVLMERPMRLTVKARHDEMMQATQAMRVNREKVGMTPEGQAPRQVFADRTTREAIEIPE